MSIDPEQLPSGDFRFRLGTTPALVADYFAPSDDAPRVLAERRRWLTDSPKLYAGLLPAGVPLLEEFAECASSWRGASGLSFDPREPAATMLALGMRLEPDFVLMAPEVPGRFRVAGGCVCFPSAWRLTDKLGRTTEETHEPVPGLNRAIGGSVDRLMTEMRGGRFFVRWNWSICPTTELNQHPDRDLPGLERPLDIDRVFLRHEHQSLFALPRTGGVVFGIRILHTSWRALRAAPEAAARMARTLRTMPEDMLAYKRLDTIRDDLVQLLCADDSP